jgi:hypothetical protein
MSKKSARKGKTTEAKAENVGDNPVSDGAATENREAGNAACTEEEMTMLSRYRAAGEDCVKELGQLEIRKARIMASYGQLEQASQNKLVEIGKRLEIPEGTAWTVKPDGLVEINPQGQGG